MDTFHLLDPALHDAVERYRGVSPASLTELAQVRAGLAAQLETQLPEPPAAVQIEDHVVPPAAHGAATPRVRVYRPRAAAEGLRPAVLHLHGGGFVIGRPEICEQASSTMALTLGCVVASVDYRLAPEHPYPAAIEDAYAALRWLHAHAAALGVDPSRIAVAGESAGGGLAAGLALLARDRGGPALCFQLLDSPMLDDRTVLREPVPDMAGQFIWTRDNSRFAWPAYLGDRAGGEAVEPYAAPARALDLAGLPPAFLCVGALDLFASENIEYARRLLMANVPVELHVHPTACHGYVLAPEALASRAYQRDAMEALRRAFEGH